MYGKLKCPNCSYPVINRPEYHQGIDWISQTDSIYPTVRVKVECPNCKLVHVFTVSEFILGMKDE